MANFGADVIKVESSGERMDPVRVQPIKGEFHFDLPDLYNEANTGKKSVTIDLADERGKDLLRGLVAHCDVLVNNYSAGSLARMGFPWEDLRRINPRLISLHLPGVGGDSPWRPLRTLGNLLKAAAGMNFQMGYPHQPPRGMGVAYPDFTSPHVGVTAILAALRAREETGEGREIELSQLSATVALLGAQWMRFDQLGEDLPRPRQPAIPTSARTESSPQKATTSGSRLRSSRTSSGPRSRGPSVARTGLSRLIGKR